MRISDLCSDVCSSDLRRSRLRRGRWLRSFLLLPLAVRGGGDALAGLAGVVVGGAKQGLEGIELPVPEAFVMADPFRAGVQGACVEVAGVHAALHFAVGRSEERRVGKECVRPWSSRWAASHYTKKSN